MKSLLTTIALAFLLSTIVLAQAPKARTSIKSGVVTLRSMVADSTLQVIYFDDFGAKQAVYNQSQSDNAFYGEVVIYKDSTIYTYSLADTLLKGRKTSRSSQLREPISDPASLSDSIKAKIHLRTLKDRKYLSKPCKGFAMDYEDVSERDWFFEGIPMYMSVQTADSSNGIDGVMPVWDVLSLQTDVPIDPIKFQWPSTLVFIEARGGFDRLMNGR